MSEEEVKAKKFVWAYMLEAGYETTGYWNVYGGRFEACPHVPYYELFYDNPKSRSYREDLKSLVKEYGVDWNATKMPVSSIETEFNGTFTENSDVEALLGDLVLKQYGPIKIGVAGAETRFKHYMAHMQKLLEDKKRVEDIFGE